MGTLISIKHLRESRDSIADIWGERTPHQGVWPARVDERVIEEPDRWVQSACVLCSTGCAVDIGVKNNRIVGVRGRAVDRVNKGRLGPKGLHGWAANESPDRLTTPLIRRNDRLEAASWEEAYQLLVDRSRSLIQQYSGNTIGFYNTGQLLLEEYSTLAIIGDGGVQTPHMDGNTRLCTATAAMALMESFGTDGDPGSYQDFDVTDCIFHIGIIPPTHKPCSGPASSIDCTVPIHPRSSSPIPGARRRRVRRRSTWLPGWVPTWR